MSLTIAGITGMLKENEQDYHTGMDISDISRQLYEYTSGYPFLVSRLCKIIDEQIAGTEDYADKSSAWTKDGFQTAVKMILYESNTLFDDMRKKFDEYPELSEMIYMVLFTGKSIAYDPDHQAMDMGIRFGFIKYVDEQMAVSNRIFEMRLYNYYLSEEMLQSSTYSASLQIKNRFIHGNNLDMELILRKFVEHFTDIYADSPNKFVEENGRRLFLPYLKPIINGTGNYHIESRTRSMGRTDVIVDYLGQQYIIEMKIYHGKEYDLRGEDQLIDYLDDYHLQKGYMLSFNLQENDLLREGGNVAFAIVTILCIVFTFIQDFLDIEMIKGFWALMFTLPASGYTVRAFRTKDKWDLIRALAGWGAVILWSVLYIKDMLAASAIL